MDGLSCAELTAALEGLREAERERYRAAAFPLFLQSSQPGLTWDQFLRNAGLCDRKPAPRVDTGRLYALAETIRAADLGRG